jgi:hypothetical protein
MASGRRLSTLSGRAPAASYALLHHGQLRHVCRAVVDGARDAQRDGRPFDVDAACKTAADALARLRSTCFDATRMRRMTLSWGRR